MTNIIAGVHFRGLLISHLHNNSERVNGWFLNCNVLSNAQGVEVGVGVGVGVEGHLETKDDDEENSRCIKNPVMLCNSNIYDYTCF